MSVVLQMATTHLVLVVMAYPTVVWKMITVVYAMVTT
jgi:hypothetical protein